MCDENTPSAYYFTCISIRAHSDIMAPKQCAAMTQSGTRCRNMANTGNTCTLHTKAKGKPTKSMSEPAKAKGKPTKFMSEPIRVTPKARKVSSVRATPRSTAAVTPLRNRGPAKDYQELDDRCVEENNFDEYFFKTNRGLQDKYVCSKTKDTKQREKVQNLLKQAGAGAKNVTIAMQKLKHTFEAVDYTFHERLASTKNAATRTKMIAYFSLLEQYMIVLGGVVRGLLQEETSCSQKRTLKPLRCFDEEYLEILSDNQEQLLKIFTRTQKVIAAFKKKIQFTMMEKIKKWAYKAKAVLRSSAWPALMLALKFVANNMFTFALYSVSIMFVPGFIAMWIRPVGVAQKATGWLCRATALYFELCTNPIFRGMVFILSKHAITAIKDAYLSPIDTVCRQITNVSANSKQAPAHHTLLLNVPKSHVSERALVVYKRPVSQRALVVYKRPVSQRALVVYKRPVSRRALAKPPVSQPALVVHNQRPSSRGTNLSDAFTFMLGLIARGDWFYLGLSSAFKSMCWLPEGAGWAVDGLLSGLYNVAVWTAVTACGYKPALVIAEARPTMVQGMVSLLTGVENDDVFLHDVAKKLWHHMNANGNLANTGKMYDDGLTKFSSNDQYGFINGLWGFSSYKFSFGKERELSGIKVDEIVAKLRDVRNKEVKRIVASLIMVIGIFLLLSLGAKKLMAKFYPESFQDLNVDFTDEEVFSKAQIKALLKKLDELEHEIVNY